MKERKRSRDREERMDLPSEELPLICSEASEENWTLDRSGPNPGVVVSPPPVSRMHRSHSAEHWLEKVHPWTWRAWLCAT